MIKKVDSYKANYFNSSNLKYWLWFKDKKLVEVRNQLTEIGFTVSKDSEVWEYFSNKYN